MPENEFEKDMQQKMEGLTFNPSGKVWDAVSSAIQQQKKRNRKFLLFLIFLFFLLTSTLFLSDISSKHFFDKPLVAKSNPQNTDKIGKPELYKPAIEISAVTNTGGLQSTVQDTAGKASTAKVPGNSHSTSQPRFTASATIAPGNTFRTAKNKKNSTHKITTTAGGGLIETTTAEAAPAMEETTQQGVVPDIVHSPVKNTVPVHTDTTGKKQVAITTVDSTKNKVTVNSETAKKSEKNKKNKWAFGISAAGGWSATNNGYFGSGNNAANYYSTSPTNSTGGYNNYVPAKAHAAGAFAAGILINYRLSAKSSATIGINYKLFTTSLAVGHDTSINNSTSVNYTGGDTKTYHNNYHFIEIPIRFQTKVAALFRHPLYLETGVSFSRLAGSNALQFNAAQYSYYTGNDLFHKTIIGFTAGLSVNIVNNNRAPFLIGPQIYYSATPLANSGFYTKAHYSFAGISIQKMLKKN